MKKCIVTSVLLCGLLNAQVVCDRDFRKNVVVCSDEKLGELMWEDGKDVFRGKIDEVKSYCEDLNFAGFSDWRLPTYSELYSIKEHRRYPTINRTFDYTIDGIYWYFDNDSKAGGVNFVDKELFVLAENFYVRCVRKN